MAQIDLSSIRAGSISRRTAMIVFCLPLLLVISHIVICEGSDLLSRSVRLTPDGTTLDLPVWRTADRLMFSHMGKYQLEVFELTPGGSEWTRLSPQCNGDNIYGADGHEADVQAADGMFEHWARNCLFSSAGASGFTLHEVQGDGIRRYSVALRDSATGAYLTGCRNTMIGGRGRGFAIHGADGRAERLTDGQRSLLVDSEFVGIDLRQSTLFVRQWSSGISAVRFDKGRLVVDVPSMHYPPDGRAFEVVLSPDGTRLAWLTDRLVETSWIDNWFRRLSRKTYFPPRHIRELGVSRLDGSDWRSVGSVEWSEPEMYLTGWRSPPEATYSPCQLQWRPDGKYVSFVFKCAIWMTKVN